MDKARVVIQELEKGFTLIQSNTENWISFWIIDPHGEDVKSFSSSARARIWWEINMKKVLNQERAESPKKLKARNEARKLVKRMGLNFDKLSNEEQEEWIGEVLQ